MAVEIDSEVSMGFLVREDANFFMASVFGVSAADARMNKWCDAIFVDEVVNAALSKAWGPTRGILTQ
jgi:hypothetical protein